MPPKRNKAPATIQTKLSFKPVSATKPQQQPLFTMETSEPLRQHMSILNKDSTSRTNGSTTSYSKSTTSIATTSSSALYVSTTVPHKENLSSRQVDSHDDINSSSNNGRMLSTKASGTHEIGGNGVSSTSSSSSVSNGGRTTPDSFSTRDLASSIPTSADTTAAKPSHSRSDRDTHGSNGYQDPRLTSKERSLKRPADSELHGSMNSPVALDSDSDDDSNKFGARKSSQSTTSTNTSTRQPSTGTSLLDQMATPRGTQPIPRATAPLPGYETAVKKPRHDEGRTAARPIMIHSRSIVSDDGFSSPSSSLDFRMQGKAGSREPEMSPPRSQSLSQGRSPMPSTVAPYSQYSQKRSGDFASLSKGGVGSAGGIAGVKSRTLPPTVSGYKAVSAVVPAYSRSSSFARNQDLERSRSRSSSPAAQAPTVAVRSTPSAFNNMSGDRTKDGMLLSEEQQHVLQEVILYHKNVFFTGSAGTGKSVLLRELIHRLRNKYKNSRAGSYWESMSTNDAVAVTASTGIAACNIGGCTLHSFAGVGLGAEALPVLVARVRKNSNAIRRWQDTKVLIIDEVSMIDSDYMDKVEALARSVRRNEQPWGGIQVVLTGDFFQLPPVNKNGTVKFCFEGQSWTSTITSTIQLQQVFRQKDQTFADMLNEMRLGLMSPATIQKFSQLTRALPTEDGLRPTELFPLRNQVEDANNRMLQSLEGTCMVYKARDSGPMRDKMEQNTLAPTTLQLKVNAQVMMLKNQSGGSGGLVNGSLGVVVGFVNRPAENDNMVGSDGRNKGSFNAPGEELPLVKFTMDNGTVREMVVGREEWKIELPNGDVQGSRIQIPLGLAWSLSIHKSQGQTLPKVKVDLGKVFEKGQAYVAMSRATTLEGLQVLNFDAKRVMVHPKVTEFYSRLNVYRKK